MKIFSLLIYLFLLTMHALSHEQENAPVHQRIVYEAYRLLKLQLSQEENGIATMDHFLGNVAYYKTNYWQNINTLTGGSSHEDDIDIIFGYKGIAGSHISITHFWDADKPSGNMHLHEGGYFPSAYQKALKYIWDDYPKTMQFKIQSGWGYKKIWCSPVPESYLYKWYWKENLWVNYSHKVAYYSLGIPFDKQRNYNLPNWDVQKSREIFFNILGRLCHLLTDMGVPEHAKRSIHPRPLYTHTAPYEHWIGHEDVYNYDFYWTAEKVLKERGGFINPFCEIDGNQNLFLFYTLSQLSDHFLSHGFRPSNGNNVYNLNVGEVESIIKSYAPTESYYFWNQLFEYGVTSASWHLSHTEGCAFRDVLLPYTIRAVAGMLYKFIIESKMQFPDATEIDMGSIYDQQQELNLFNQYINGDHYTYRAEGIPGRITVCPDVVPEGYDKDFTIGPDTRNVTFRAAKEVVFKPGFTATHGSQVHAYTCADCSRENQAGNCHQCLQEDYNPQYDRSR